GMPYQEIVDRADAIKNALGIIEALDTDADTHIGWQREAPPDCVATFADGSLLSKCRRRPFNRDRIGSDQGFLPTECDRCVLAIDAALHEAIRRFQKIVAEEFGVEAKDGASQQAVDNLLAPWTDDERFGIGPRDMPKGDDRGLWQPVADHPGEQAEV